MEDKLKETNSEKSFTFWGVMALISGGTLALATFFVESGAFEAWPAVTTVLGVVVAVSLSVSKMVSSYTASRPGKTMAVTVRAEKLAAAAQPPAPPDPK